MKKGIKKLIAVFAISLSFAGFISGCSNNSSESSNSSITSKNTQDIILGSKEELENAPFQITVLNTKKGASDAILIKIEDKYVIIDTGLSDASKKLKKLIEGYGTDTIDYVILSHLDKDHIGGVDKIIDKFNVNNIIQPNYMEDSKQYGQYIKAAQEKNISIENLTSNKQIEINGAKINIYPPEKSKYTKSNDYSLIVEIEYGNYNYLFAGDAEEQRLQEFLKTSDKQYTFVKIPHHGRFNIMTPKFLESTSPEFAAITSSDKEPADNEVLSLLKDINAETLIADTGNIVIKSNGTKINMWQESEVSDE